MASHTHCCDQKNYEERSDDSGDTWRNVGNSCHDKDDFKIRDHILESFIDNILADERLNIGKMIEDSD